MLQALGAVQAPQVAQQPLPQQEPVADYTWKIANFTRKLAQAKSNNGLGALESEPFFSSHGYRMKLEMNINEAQRGCPGYTGVYLSFLRSDRDGSLPWPFTKRYIFVLVDQQDDPSQKQNIRSVIIPNENESYKRPWQHANSGVGLRQFAKHSTLRTRQYIRDHAVYIKIIIDP